MTILVSAYAVIWIALEGNLARVTLLGWALTVVAFGHLFQRWIGGRTASVPSWLALCAALGALAGFCSGAATLVFMALKTGLHAHGPEFAASEIEWVAAQIPWWTSAGLLAGLGLGALYVVMRRS